MKTETEINKLIELLELVVQENTADGGILLPGGLMALSQVNSLQWVLGIKNRATDGLGAFISESEGILDIKKRVEAGELSDEKASDMIDALAKSSNPAGARLLLN